MKWLNTLINISKLCALNCVVCDLCVGNNEKSENKTKVDLKTAVGDFNISLILSGVDLTIYFYVSTAYVINLNFRQGLRSAIICTALMRLRFLLCPILLFHCASFINAEVLLDIDGIYNLKKFTSK